MEMVAAGSVFPSELARSVVTAEEAGTLEQEMARWAALMQANTDEAMARLASWLPKVIYFGVLLLVAYQVLHLFWVSYLGPLRGMLE